MVVVFNLSEGDIENTIRPTTGNIRSYKGYHAVIMVDDDTIHSRARKLQNALRGIVVASKVVDTNFSDQWMMDYTGLTV